MRSNEAMLRCMSASYSLISNSLGPQRCMTARINERRNIFFCSLSGRHRSSSIISWRKGERERERGSSSIQRKSSAKELSYDLVACLNMWKLGTTRNLKAERCLHSYIAATVLALDFALILNLEDNKSLSVFHVHGDIPSDQRC